MSTSSDQDGDTPPPKPTKSQVILMFGTMADTSWRMFIPIISLTVLGIWADRSWQTKPWMTVAGIIIGVILAGLLVQRQLERVKK
jgi:F0F1-type ATP synthase assembly protein I